MNAPRRWAELRAVLGWIVGSWVRPAGSEAHWEQPHARRRGAQPSGGARSAPPTQQHTSSPPR